MTLGGIELKIRVLQHQKTASRRPLTGRLNSPLYRSVLRPPPSWTFSPTTYIAISRRSIAPSLGRFGLTVNGCLTPVRPEGHFSIRRRSFLIEG